MFENPTAPANPWNVCVPDNLRPFAEWRDIPGQGGIQLISAHGNEALIEAAARTTAGAEAGTEERTDEQRRNLLRYLLRHNHGTPFEFAHIIVCLEIPMDTWRQMVRHRTASINEYSTRYSPALDSFATVPEGQWRAQSRSNRQGSAGLVSNDWKDHLDWREGVQTDADAETLTGVFGTPQEHLSHQEEHFHVLAQGLYRERLRMGVAKEQARKDLPLSQMTRAYWTVNFRNLLHFLGLRMDSHAQKEIRDYANWMGQVVEAWMPNVWEAFRDYRLEAVTFSRQEMAALRVLISHCPHDFTTDVRQAFLEKCGIKTKRERAAFWRNLGVAL